jgi:chromosome segregation ATPase
VWDLTAISQLIVSLKKNRNQLAKMEKDTTKRINRIVFEFETLLGVAERVKTEWTARRAKEKTLAKEVNQLEREVSKLETSRDSIQTTITTKQQDLDIAEKTLRSTEMKLSEAKSKLKRSESNLRETEEKVQKNQDKSKARDRELNSLQSDQEDLMVYLDREILALKDEQNELTSKYWALRFFLREGIISTPEAKIVKVLEGKKTSSLQELQDETYLTRYRVEKVVDQLAKRGLLRIEPEGDSIIVLKPLKIEA